MNHKKERVVRASEIGLYTYCTRAWQLGQIKGYRSVNRAVLETGKRAHQTHGRAVAGYHRLRRAAHLLLGLALLAGFMLLLITTFR